MARFRYASMFPVRHRRIAYRTVTDAHVERQSSRLGDFLVVEPQALRRIAQEAFRDVSFLLRTRHLEQIAAALHDPQASDNDRFVAQALLRNAVIAAEGILPLCQDAGTAGILAFKGERALTGSDDARHLAHGVYDAYRRENLRYSQMIPRSMLDEDNSGTNLPAQIRIHSERGDQYRFLFMAKGAGSSNKTQLHMESKALLNSERRLSDFLRENIRALGVAACPPYHLVAVIGGLSPEMNLDAVKLASSGWLDGLPAAPSGAGHAWRDREWETKLLKLARASGLGMQFTGRHFALDTRVIRLPRHAGSLPVGLGVACNAHRNILGKITASGIHLEKLERQPARFLEPLADSAFPPAVPIDLAQPMDRIVAALAHCPAGTRVALTGPLIVARDLAHARLKQRLDDGRALPAWFSKHPVYYAGPAKTPPGRISGSFGPTTAMRMDPYVPEFMRHGASRVMLAKGERGDAVRQACRKHNGFYLATIGGAAALVAERSIHASEIVDFPELGMEAVRKVQVENLPAFVVFDSKGRNLYAAAAPERE